jgi:hypothetical protein
MRLTNPPAVWRSLSREQPENIETSMKMLYEARTQDLGPGDFVRVECAACGHEELIPAIGLQQGMRLPPDTLGARPQTPDALPRVRREGEGGGVD